MAFIERSKQQRKASVWSPGSWRHKAVRQLPTYPDLTALANIESQLQCVPPLVVPFEIDTLKQQLAKAARGDAFLLQGGDCAERFIDCNRDIITNKLKILLQMSAILLYGLRKPIIRIGRIAGQYAKPRSSEYEIRDGIRLPNYRGDAINCADFNAQARTPDPTLLLDAYTHSAKTLNYLRALVQHGFADLQHPEYWDIDFIHYSESKEKYQAILQAITNAIDFANAAVRESTCDLTRVDLYTSHEALLLPYEQALTHQYQQQWYNLSTHFPWVGMRTAQLDSAHIEYIRGITNPIAIKVGPDMTAMWLTELVNKLNPDNEPGRLTLVHRMGATQVETRLPSLIKAVCATGKTVLWCCDPMHGNTEITAGGIKTRHFDNILEELRLSFAVHANLGTYLGGVHFELTGDDITECIGGARGLTTNDLTHAYKSLVDPRLNYEQSLEMAMQILECINESE